MADHSETHRDSRDGGEGRKYQQGRAETRGGPKLEMRTELRCVIREG